MVGFRSLKRKDVTRADWLMARMPGAAFEKFGPGYSKRWSMMQYAHLGSKGHSTTLNCSAQSYSEAEPPELRRLRRCIYAGAQLIATSLCALGIGHDGRSS